MQGKNGNSSPPKSKIWTGYPCSPFVKERKGKKKEVVYATQDVRKTVIKYIRIFKRRNKGKEAPWVVPQGTFLRYDDEGFHPSELKLRCGRYERLEKKYLSMCYKELELVFAVLSEIGHPVTESSGWQDFEKEYSFAGELLGTSAQRAYEPSI